MKKTILTLVIFLASATAWAQDSATPVTKQLRNVVREGNEYYEKGNYAKALESYEVALQLNPASQVALYNKALALTNMAGEDTKGTENDPRQQAMQIFEQVAKTCTATADSALAEKAWYNLGNMAYNDQDYGKSIERYKEALRINPDNNRTRQNLRLAQLKQQNQDQNQDQDKQDQQQQQQQQQQQDQQEQEQQQQQQQQPMTQSAEQILQAMQNKENATRRKQKEPAQPSRRTTDKPW